MLMPLRRAVIIVGAVIGVAALAAVLQQGDRLGFLTAAPAAQEAPPPAAATVPVTVAPVERRAMPDLVEAVGTVQSIASIQVLSRVDSQVSAVAVQDGAPVKAGDLLFTLDSADVDARLAQAQAVLARDQAALDYNNAQLKRYSALASKQWQSQEQLDQVKSASVSGAAVVQADEAAVRQLQVEHGWHTIKSPLTGRIGVVAAHVGTTVKANDPTTPLVTINQISPIYASFAVPQRFLPAIRAAREAQPVEVRIDGREAPVPGKVAVINNAVDQTTGTITLQAIFDNRDEVLWPGQSVQVRLTLGVDPSALVVPAQAVQVGQDGAYVFVVSSTNGRTIASARNVKMVRTVDGSAVLAAGVEAGEQVVVEGQLRLDDGTPVKVRQAAADARQAG